MRAGGGEGGGKIHDRLSGRYLYIHVHIVQLLTRPILVQPLQVADFAQPPSEDFFRDDNFPEGESRAFHVGHELNSRTAPASSLTFCNACDELIAPMTAMKKYVGFFLFKGDRPLMTAMEKYVG